MGRRPKLLNKFIVKCHCFVLESMYVYIYICSSRILCMFSYLNFKLRYLSDQLWRNRHSRVLQMFSLYSYLIVILINFQL